LLLSWGVMSSQCQRRQAQIEIAVIELIRRAGKTEHRARQATVAGFCNGRSKACGRKHLRHDAWLLS